MNGVLYPGILLLLTLASMIVAFEEEEPYHVEFGNDDNLNDVGEDYGGPQISESPRRQPPFRKGGRKGKGAQCNANGECSGNLNCCRTSGSIRTQCWPCLGRNYQCQRQSDCAHPLVCSQKIDPRNNRFPIGRRRCIALPLNRPPPADEQIVRGRPGK